MHDPQSLACGPDENGGKLLPTFAELINSAPPEYLSGEPFRDENGETAHLVTMVTDRVSTLTVK